jgi:large subunit ribosomal protein L15
MQWHTLKRTTKKTAARRVGRGGKRGKTAGRGMKGQKARAGRKLRPELRDLIKKVPKLRGHGKNRAQSVNDRKVRPVAVNLDIIELSYETGETVSPQTLVKKALVRSVRGKAPLVKILGTGTITKKVTVVSCEISKTAKDKIVAAGGTA